MSNLSKNPAFWDWELHDDDCCQYFRKIGPRTYEMIQCIWLDAYEEDPHPGHKEFVVVTGKINLNDLSGEEIEDTIKAFGYTLSQFEEWEEASAQSMIAECYLEDALFKDSCVIASFNSFPETEAFVEKWISEHKLDESVFHRINYTA